jgi:hypothetical protein
MKIKTKMQGGGTDRCGTGGGGIAPIGGSL